VLNHYRICKSEGKTALCAICAPVIQHIRQSSDQGSTGGSLGGLDGDELDTFAMGSDGGLGEDPLGDPHIMIGTPGVDDDVAGMGICQPVVDAGAGGQMMPIIEPLDAFASLTDQGDAFSHNPTTATVQAMGAPPMQRQSKNNDGLLPQAAALGMGMEVGMPPNINPGVPQAIAMVGMSQSQGGQSTNNNGSVQDMQQEFQKKQVLLRQVQQQKVRKNIEARVCAHLISIPLTKLCTFFRYLKANLFGQSQRLQQQLMDASNPQQAQQLQKQQTILQQLNQQFEQQQSILQSEIQRQAILLHQRQQQQGSNQVLGNGAMPSSHDLNVVGDPGELKRKLGDPNGNDKGVNAASKKAKAKASSTAASAKKSVASKKSGANTNTKASKRSSEVAVTKDGESRPLKIPKISDAGLSTQKHGAKPDKQNGTPTESGGVSCNLSSTAVRKSSSVSAASSDKGGSSLIKCMPIPAIEQHLESLISCGQLTPRCISRKCLPLVKNLINHDDGWVFRDAVDPFELGIPDYFDIVENPMDLTLVVNKLEDGAYKDVASFEKDTKLVFENAILFNGEDSDVGNMAKALLASFAKDLKNTMKGEVGNWVCLP
jgi:hypothetical protein